MAKDVLITPASGSIEVKNDADALKVTVVAETVTTANKTLTLPNKTGTLAVTTDVPNITGAASTVVTDNLTASRAVVSNASGKIDVSTVTSTELGYVSGVTSAIQTQINGTVKTTGDQSIAGTKTFTGNVNIGGTLDLTNTGVIGALDMSNNSIVGVNNIVINDPGPSEGIQWAGGNAWAIYESPNDLTTNSGGNLQIVQNTTRRATFNTSGQLEIPVATGTSPLSVTSTTAVTNLNADFVDGQHASYFLDTSGNAQTKSGPLTINNNLSVNRYFQNATGIPTSNLGSPTVTEMALFDEQFDNKTAFYPIANLKFYTSTDNITFTEHTTPTDTQKRRFLGGDINSGITIPNLTPYFRIEITNAGGYVFLNALYIYWASQSHSTTVKIRARRRSDLAFIQWTNSSSTVSAWPGHLYLPFSTIPFLTGGTSSGHYDIVHIDFQPTWSGNALYGTFPIILDRLQLWGGYPAGKRNIYSTDENRNVSFPTNLHTSGYLGVGTTSPLTRLYITDNADSQIFVNKTSATWTGYATGTHAMQIVAPNMGNASNLAAFEFGKALSSKNSAHIDYMHRGDGSNSNYLSFGLFGANELVNLNGAGNVGIGTTTPSEKLDVNGNIKAVDLILSGNLTVNGTTTNINTTNLVVEDKNIVIGDVATPTDVTADGGGITLKGATDKTIEWLNATNRWTSNQVFGAPNYVSTVATGTQPYATTSTTVNTNLNADLLDGLHASAFVSARTRTNWNTATSVISNVVGELAWKNYGNNHTIFDASNSTTPSGTTKNNTNPDIFWSATYPTLMGWNGTNTYGVRVDSARVSDNTTGSSERTTFVNSPDGDRVAGNKLPTSNPRTVRFDFATSGSVGAGNTGNYAGVMTYAPWDGTTSSTGDSSYQLAFVNDTGGNGTGLPGLRLRKGIDSTWGSWNKIWHEGNDGTGSGLDADLLDGLNATSANTVSTIVARDASGNFSAGAISGTSLSTGSGASTWSIDDNTANVLTFKDGATTRLEIKSSGLHVNGSTTALGSGTVTGVTATSPIASSGGSAPVISVASGFTIPTSTEKGNYDTAYTHSTTTTGSVHGSTTVGGSLLRLTNPGAITFLRVNADNTVTARSASDFRSDIGAGTGNGTVTSVTGTSPVASSGGTTPAISLASGYGDTLNPYASKTQKTFLAAPNGANGVPTFRTIAVSDVPTLNQSTTGSAGSVANSLVLKFDTGTTEGTDLYTFNGSGAKTVDFKSGTNVTLTETAGVVTFSSPSLSLGTTSGSGNAVTDISVSGHTVTMTKNSTFLTGNQSITLSGDVSGTGATAITTTLANSGVTAGSYTAATVTVDAKGRVTSASSNTIPTVNNGTLTLAVSGTGLSGSASFTANQSTASTFTVTSNATSANTASTIVARDGSGNFSAGAITGTSLSAGTGASTWTIDDATANVLTFKDGATTRLEIKSGGLFVNGSTTALGTFGTTAGTYTQGNDARLSDARTPLSHTHGNILNNGTITAAAVTIETGDRILITNNNNSQLIERGIDFGTSTTSFLANNGTWVTPAGGGDVTGPASAVSGRVATFNGTTGKIIQDGGTLLSNLVSGPASSVNARIVTFNGTTGKLIQDSGTLISGLATSTHTHGNITNAGAIGATSGLVVVTGASGVLTTEAKYTNLYTNSTPLTISSGGTQTITLNANATTINFGSNANTGTRFRIKWGTTTATLLVSFVHVQPTTGSDAFTYLSEIIDVISGNDITALMYMRANATGTSSTTSWTFGGGRTMTMTGTQTNATMYLYSIDRVNF